MARMFVAAACLVWLAVMLPRNAAHAQVDQIIRGLIPGMSVPSGPPPPSYGQRYGAGELTFNDNPQAVADARRMLAALGYDTGPATGGYDARLAQAVTQFQRDHQLPATGNMTQRSIGAMDAALRARAAAPLGPDVPPTASIRPSFDCGRASTPAERTICRVPRLAELDQELSDAYAHARATTQDPTLQSEQRTWRGVRDACGGGPVCLEERMRTRLAELRRPVPVEATRPGTPAEAPGTFASAVANAPGFGDRLATPPAGLQPVILRRLDGVPIIAGSSLPGERAFNLLLGLSFQPGMLEQGGSVDWTAQFAATFLPRGNDFLGPFGSWAGADEFQRQDNLARFLREYGSALRGMAIKAPFRFAMMSGPFSLSQYDPVRRGFVLPDLGTPSLAARAGDGPISLSGTQRPPTFLPMDEAAARQLVAAAGKTRTIRSTLTFEATSFDLQNLTVNVRQLRVALYDDALQTMLYEFPRAEGPSEASAIARLAQPPQGMRAFSMPSLDGLPLFQEGNTSPGDLLLLVGLGNIDDHDWESLHGLDIARRLLSDQARKDTLGLNGWAGADEFARDRTRDTFFQRELPIIKAAAPRLPFAFAFAQGAGIGQYDAQRRGFPLGGGSKGFTLDVGSAVDRAGMRAALPFAWPDAFWPLDPAQAESTLRSLPDRYVTVVGVLEAGEVTPPTRTLTLRLRSMSVYTRDLRTKLYDMPVTLDRPSGLSVGVTSLRFAAPVPVDALFACAKLFQTMGGHPAQAPATRCWSEVQQRDAATYARPGGLAGLAAGDAGWPFFPRSAGGDYAATAEAFSRYMLAYAAGIDGSVIQITTSGPQDNGGDMTVYAFGGSGGSTGLDEVGKAAGGLQGDQLIPLGTSYDRTLYGALPNRASLYSVTVPRAELAGLGGTTKLAVSLARVGPAREVPGDGHYRAASVVMDVTPISAKVTASGRVLASRSFGEVPRLDASSFSRPATAAVAPPAGPLLFDSGLADLLAAALVGARLSPEAVVGMILRRWSYENEPPPSIGDGRGGGTPYASPGATRWGALFFTVGKRRPTADEAARLREPFLAWAQSAAPPLPLAVMTPGRIELRKNQSAISWSSMPCFQGMSLGTGSDAAYKVLECQRKRSGAAGSGPSLLPSEERTCLALEAEATTTGYAQSLGFMCHGNLTGLGFADPATFSIRIPHELTVPQLSFLGDTHVVFADAMLEVTGVTLMDHAPKGADLLPDALRDHTGSANPGGTAVKEFVVYDTAFQGTRWREPDGTEVARLTPEQGNSVQAAVRRYEASLASLSKPDSRPVQDLLGIRLGMSFEEAERLIRDNMPVDRMLQGKRASDPAANTGAIEPLTSGKLFIRQDGQEVVALFDEPPAAPGRVMAVWRRVYINPASGSAEDLLNGLSAKYGPMPRNAPFRPGQQLTWPSVAAGNCQSLVGPAQRRPLSASWADDGKGMPSLPNVGFMPGVQAPPQGPYWPSALTNVQSEWPPPQMRAQAASAATECGSAVNAIVYDAQMARMATNVLDVTLTNVGAYLAAFEDNRRQLQATRPTVVPPPIKF